MHHARVGDHADVLDLDTWTLPQSHVHAKSVGGISCRGNIQRDPDIRVDSVSCRCRPAHANFLLGGEHEIKIIRRGLEGAQGFNSDQDTHAIVHRFRDQAVPQITVLAVKRGHVANAHGTILWAGRADVNVHFIQGGQFVHVVQTVKANNALRPIQKANAPAKHISSKYAAEW